MMIDAKKYLLKVQKYDKLIQNKIAEVEQWRAMALSTTSRLSEDKVQASGSQTKMADAVAKYVDLEKEIDKLIDRLIDERKDIIAVIEQLPPIEYDVLHKKYIQYDKYEDFKSIASEYGQSYSWATTVHGRALEQVRAILEAQNAENSLMV